MLQLVPARAGMLQPKLPLRKQGLLWMYLQVNLMISPSIN